MKRRTVLVIISALLVSLAPRATAAEGGDARFEDVARAYFTAGFEAAPSAATAAGLHADDERLDDVSAAAYAAQLARDRATLAKLKAIDPAGLSPEVAIDRTMLVGAVDDDLLLTGELAAWKHNPDTYVGIASSALYALIARDFAPAATRLRDAIARERQIPRLLAQAQGDLTTVDATTKAVALEDAAGAVDFLSHDVPLGFTGARDPGLQSKLRAAGVSAANAMRRYEHFVANIEPQGTFAIGKDAYDKRLRYEDALDVGVDRYLAYGRKALAETRARFVATAKQIEPTKPPRQVYEALGRRHPTARGLNAAASKDLVKLRAFIVDHRIVSLAPGANVAVADTPAFQRAFLFAQLDSPGPLETTATNSYYDVTPPDPAWPAARIETYLAGFNDYGRPITSAHEVYPGHFVNVTIDRRLKLSLTRKLLWNSEFGEGWAHYGEQMMVDEGWGGGDPRVRLAQLQLALLRNCRYVAGVELHAAGWTLAQSEKLFTDECFQSRVSAIRETVRGTQDPMYGYYTLGKLMILKLRADYHKKLGNAFTLRKFHDELLAHGDPPLPLLRPLILGSADDGKPL